MPGKEEKTETEKGNDEELQQLIKILGEKEVTRMFKELVHDKCQEIKEKEEKGGKRE
jgi:hypothetical protein